MTLSKWIENYCEENGIELPSDIPDEETALKFIETVNSTIISAPTSDDVGKVVKVVASDEPDKVILPETTFTRDDEWLPNPVDEILTNPSLLDVSQKLMCKFTGNSTVIGYADWNGYEAEFLFDDFSVNIFREEESIYVFSDVDIESMKVEISSVKNKIEYVDENDVIINFLDNKWKSHLSYQELLDIIYNGQAFKLKTLFYLRMNVGTSQNPNNVRINGTTCYYYILEINDELQIISNCSIRCMGKDATFESMRLKPDGTVEYYD